MADDETTRLKAVAQQQEPVFIPRVIRIVNQAGALVKENGLRFLEGNAMPGQVGSSLTSIPGKLDIAHSIILAIEVL
jgi:hypothetical protein